MKKIVVVSVSGGMDSTSLLLRLLREDFQVYVVSFDYGQKHKIELERLNDNLNYLSDKGFEITDHRVDLSVLGTMYDSALTSKDIEVPEGHYEEDQMKLTVVPNRNAIFSSIIYGYALSLANKFDTNVLIAMGLHSGDHQVYPDCRQEFRDAIQYAFQIGNWGGERVSYYTPYLEENKTTILKDALVSCEQLDLDFDTVLRNTNTSYNPTKDGKSSGTSGADIERIEAFINIGRVDPVEYVNGWEVAKSHAEQVLNSREK